MQPATFNIQLPSEAEWEKAARGTQGHKFPWGNTWQEDRANVEATDLKQTNPVGMFPEGGGSYGVMEMAGNVWEWTRSRWGEGSIMQADYGYPYDPEDGREALDEIKISILRGGSWLNNEWNARCAYRIRNNPGIFNNDNGLRLVVSLVLS